MFALAVYNRQELGYKNESIGKFIENKTSDLFYFFANKKALYPCSTSGVFLTIGQYDAIVNLV